MIIFMTSPAMWSASVAIDPPEDADDWKHFLQSPFDPWLQEAAQGGQTLLLLRTSSFDGLERPAEVHDRALPIIERLNGAFRLSQGFGASALRLSSMVVQINADGSLAVHHFLQPPSVVARVKFGRPTIVVTDAAGNVIPPPPTTASVVQAWSTLASSDDVIEELLMHFARCDNWFDLYKTYELIKSRCGGEHELYAYTAWAPKAQVRRMRETANFYRHATTPRPTDPINFDDARNLLQAMLKGLLDEIQKGKL